MKILFVSESPLQMAAGDYYGSDPWIRFPIHLSRHCEQLTLWAPAALRSSVEEVSEEYWRLPLEKMRIVPHDDYGSFASFYRMWPRRVTEWRRNALELARQHDIVLLRMPSPMTSLIGRAARSAKKPLVLFIAGNVETQSDRILASRGAKRLLYQFITKAFVFQEVRWAKRASLIYAYSREIAERHHGSGEAVKFIRTPHLTNDDISYRDDTCQSSEIRLLRVCWLVPSKGLEYLLEAVALLREREVSVKLEIVGRERGDSNYLQKLQQMVQKLQIGDRVIFSGWRRHDVMGEVFERSDIQIISSLSEGTPRVILEGAARGVPLVSSRAGGCGDNLNDGVNALLVPPRDSKALADAIARLVADKPLRRKLIQNGYDMAKYFTFEKFGLKILHELHEVCDR